MSKNTIDNYFNPKKRNQPSNDDQIELDPNLIEEIQEEKPKQYVYVLPCHLEDFWVKIKRKLNVISSGDCSLKEIAVIIQDICVLQFEQKRRVDVENLVVYFNDLSSQKAKFYVQHLLPFMARIALEIEHAFNDNPILLLIQDEESTQTFTKLQVAILICNMFFCTLHQQPSSCQIFPSNFDCSLLFMEGKNIETNAMKRQKISFLFEYFTSLQKEKLNLDLLVSYERVCGLDLKDQIRSQKLKDECKDKLSAVIVDSKKKIEDNQNSLQVVFANKLVGGGVLGNGSIQEEIRYLISPECLVSLLLFEQLQDFEALVIKGTQQISKYSGYKNSLQFEGPYDGKEPIIDPDTNMYSVVIVGIDALNYNSNKDDNIQPEFSLESLMREIRKAYAGFSNISVYPTSEPRKNTVSTGNWGCGDFGGDKEIKFFIQWIAASLAKVKTLNFHTQNDALQEADIKEMVSILGNAKVKQAYSLVREYVIDRKINGPNNYENISLFQYIATFYN